MHQGGPRPLAALLAALAASVALLPGGAVAALDAYRARVIDAGDRSAPA